MNRKFKYFPGLFVIVLALWSCGSQRKNPIAKTYHNTAAHFNYHYNGELKFKEGVNTINANYRIPPEGYVPVLVVGTEKDAQSTGSIFEEAQKKAEVGLLKHPNAKCKDDFRFLIGRAWFYRRNFILAQQNFEYILKEFPKSKLKPDVLLWLVKTHLMNDNKETALEVLEKELKDVELNKKQKGHLAIIKAQIELEQKNYEACIKTLEENREYIKGRNNKARVHYLLGQLYADDGKFTKSYENYKRVTKLNTDYEFIFNAKLRIARLHTDNQEGADETQSVYKMLRKMLRDEKNTEYKDQIYYEMALLNIKKGNLDGAIDDLKQSVKFNTSNQRQKALSYYRIGQIYFNDKKDYINAQVYFDSASVAINKDAPEYNEISNISKTLKEYVNALNTIHYQDSMVKLAALDSNALKRAIDKVIEAEKRKQQEEEERMQEELDRLNDPNLFNQQGNKPSSGGAGGWPFDLPDQVSNGRMEFQRQWGMRKNEDNWNRKNKTIMLAESNTPEEAVDSGLVSKYGGSRAKYYKDIPKNQDEIDAAHEKIASAMYQLGQIYHNRLSQTDSAITVYNRLIRRYPEKEQSFKALYALFKIYEKDDPYKADDYKNKICTARPASLYCRLCKKEDVSADLNESLKEYQSAYNALYASYDSKEYETVVNFSNFVIERFNSNEDIASVYYVRGLSYGKLGDRDSLRKIFSFIRTNFPEHEVTPVVIRTLELMDKGNANNGGKPKQDDNQPKGDEHNYEGFVPDIRAGEQVYVAVLIDKTSISSPQLQIKVNSFNTTNFTNDKLTAALFLYQNKQHLAYVGTFPDFAKAKAYVDEISKSEDITPLLKAGDAIVFITPENFRVAYGQKRFEDYISYYNTVLLKIVNGK